MRIRHLLPLLFLAAPAFAQAPPAADVARIEEVVQSFVSNQQFMGTVLVARGDNVLLSKGYGSANLEWNVPNTPATKFRIGSVTKQFTAAAILLLEERGKLKVEDPVKKHLPDAPAAWDAITIFHVLTHTSGIPSFTSSPDYARNQMFPASPETIVGWFRDKPLEFAPGARFNYSNSGYVLLGYLVEKISGQTYEAFLQQNIFTPLGMKDSGYDSSATVIERRASGYTPGPNGRTNAGFVNMTIPHGAGALYSTTEDLLRWERGLFGGKLLKPASLQKMTTPFKDNYAFGVLASTVDGRKQVWHNGGIQGFNSAVAYYPDTGVTVAVLSNLNGAAPDQMMPKLGAVANGGTIQLQTERKEITVAPTVLAQYVGTYELVPRVNMMITLEGAQLMSQMSGQGKIPIFAESETKFFPKVVDAVIEFVKDDKGAVTDLILHQGGRDQKARKTSDKVAERQEVAVAPQILAAYAGSYELAPGFDLTVTVENNQLMAQATGQPKFALFGQSETSFFAKVVDVQVDFFKDDKGAISHLVLHQGPRDTTARRK